MKYLSSLALVAFLAIAGMAITANANPISSSDDLGSCIADANSEYGAAVGQAAASLAHAISKLNASTSNGRIEMKKYKTIFNLTLDNADFTRDNAVTLCYQIHG